MIEFKTKRPKDVVLARHGEEEEILSALLEMHEEIAFYRANTDVAMEFIKNAINQKEGIIGVIRGPNGIEGTIGMRVAKTWYSAEDDWHLEELWCFVRKPYRKSRHAHKLIQFAKWCAEQMNVPLSIGIFTNRKTASKERLYRQLLPKVGAFFLWNSPKLKDINFVPRDKEATGCAEAKAEVEAGQQP